MVDDSDDPLRVFLAQYENTPDMSTIGYFPIAMDTSGSAGLPLADYSNEGRNYPTTESTQGSGGSAWNASAANASWVDALNLPSWLKNAIKNLGKDASEFLEQNYGKLGLAGLMAYLASQQARPAMGGGTTQAYKSPAPLKRDIVQGKYGPVAQYAANGGLMHAYAHGGHVNMEDGGFVMTKRAVDGAGGPRGLAALVPGVRPIRGPGTGTSDSIPATIHGPRGQTPARVSNGEAYVPRETVQRMGGAQQMYDLMNNLQRRG